LASFSQEDDFVCRFEMTSDRLNQLHPLSPGLVAVTGGECTGKTSLLRRLSGDLVPLPGEEVSPNVQWLDLALPGRDDELPEQVWESLHEVSPQWDTELHNDLIEALGLEQHLGKKLYMLSTGSRRKVALVGLLACGAAVTCLDQPYVALDRASIEVVRDFLREAAAHPIRTWVIADYEADPHLPWSKVLSLD
jgi:ABC-type transport system involved in cytochrome c biogenesis ATPase subunit